MAKIKKLEIIVNDGDELASEYKFDEAKDRDVDIGVIIEANDKAMRAWCAHLNENS